MVTNLVQRNPRIDKPSVPSPRLARPCHRPATQLRGHAHGSSSGSPLVPCWLPTPRNRTCRSLLSQLPNCTKRCPRVVVLQEDCLSNTQAVTRTPLNSSNNASLLGLTPDFVRRSQDAARSASPLNWENLPKWSYGDSNPRPLACHESLGRRVTRRYAV